MLNFDVDYISMRKQTLMFRICFRTGKQLDGIWHTGIVAYGQEWFFGGMGIESCRPVSAIQHQPPLFGHYMMSSNEVFLYFCDVTT